MSKYSFLEKFRGYYLFAVLNKYNGLKFIISVLYIFIRGVLRGICHTLGERSLS
jgi:hypothetical protein